MHKQIMLEKKNHLAEYYYHEYNTETIIFPSLNQENILLRITLMRSTMNQNEIGCPRSFIIQK